MIIRMQPEPVHPSAPLTRLVATLGPNSSSVEQLTALLQAGMQVWQCAWPCSCDRVSQL